MAQSAQSAYGIGRLVATSSDETTALVREALKAEGFGVLCEIDVQATMKEKLGIEHGKYVILGAGNPPLARRALTAEPQIGLMLPCNVIVYETDDGTQVSAVDPQVMLGMVKNPDLEDVAAQVRARLVKVLERI
jgi:uncharacterized protein (DUF302 family)